MGNKFVKVNHISGEFLGWAKDLDGSVIHLENAVRLLPGRVPGEVRFVALCKDKNLASSTVRIGTATAIVFEMAPSGPMFDAYEQETSSIIMARPKIMPLHGAN